MVNARKLCAITQLVMHEVQAPRLVETLNAMARCAIYRRLAAARSPSAEYQVAYNKSIKSNVCTNAQQLLAGTQISKQIGTDIQAVYVDIQTDFSLTPLCAASLMVDFVQKVITGTIGAGSCPAAS
jgi:hypothetical protein